MRFADNSFYTLSESAQKVVDEASKADIRVWELLDLICAEWRTDPLSVQCFDARIVQEAIALVERRKAMQDMFNPFDSK